MRFSASGFILPAMVDGGVGELALQARPRDLADRQRAALRRFMVQRNLTNHGWTRAAGIANNTLRNFLIGKTESMTDANLRRLAQAAGVAIDVMFGSETSEPGIPVIDYVQAGSWTQASDPYPAGQGHARLTPDVAVGATAFALDIKGNSMEPEFREGDRIVVDPARKPLPGDFVVAKTGHPDESSEATFKKFTRPRPDRVELVPLNPDHPTLTIDRKHPGHIVGVVVEHRRYWRRAG